MKRLLYILGFLFNVIVSIAQQNKLDYFIEQALANSPLLKDYQNRQLSLALDSLIIRAGLKPQVNFVSNNLYAPVFGGWGYDEIITNKAQLSAMVQASKNFLSKASLAAQYEQIALQRRSLGDTLFLSRKDLRKTIIEQYITAYGELLTIDYSKELYDLMTKEEEALKKLAQSSVIKQTEFLAFDITLKQQELTYLQAQIQYNTDFLTLNYLAGIVDTTIVRLEEPRLNEGVLADIYSTVFFQRYTTDSLRIVNEKRLIEMSYRPSISAVTDAGYNSSLQNTPYKNFGFSVGLNIKVPLYDGHQKKLKYQKLDLEERTRIANRDFFLNQYRQQIKQLYIQLRGTDELFQKIKEQVRYSKTLIEAYGKLLETSDVKITDFVTAITNYMNAQNLFRQNFISRLKIMNQINYWNQ
jgi:outer membrane protein TolC